jgi:hypothetical protein
MKSFRANGGSLGLAKFCSPAKLGAIEHGPSIASKAQLPRSLDHWGELIFRCFEIFGRCGLIFS